MRTEEGSVSEVTASRSSRERNITTEQNLQNCSSTSIYGIVTQLARGNCVVGSSPTYPKGNTFASFISDNFARKKSWELRQCQKIINGTCQDSDKHNAIIDSYANNENGHR